VKLLGRLFRRGTHPDDAAIIARISKLESDLADARTFPGRKRVIEAFEDELASFQYAIAAMQQLDKDYGMDSSHHIKVLKAFFQACRAEIKAARDAISTDLQTAMSGKEYLMDCISGTEEHK